jgi:hypothetical protein
MIVKVEFWPEFTGNGPVRVFPVLDGEFLEKELSKAVGGLAGPSRAEEVREWVLSMGGALDSAELRSQQDLDLP